MPEPNTAPSSSGGGIKAFVEGHPTLVIGGGLILLLLIAGSMLKKNLGGVSNPTTDPNATGADLSGLTPDGKGGHIVYVPTQTSFTTDNVGADFSNDPNLKSIKTGNIYTNSNPYTLSTENNTTTTTTTNPPPRPVVNPPIVIPPVHVPPPQDYYWDKDHDRKIYQDGHTVYTGTGTGGTWTPGNPDDPGAPTSWGKQTQRAAPPPQLAHNDAKGTLVWDSQHTMGRGQTLPSIATKVTHQLRSQGMPGSTSVHWTDIYARNTTVLTPANAARHNTVVGGPHQDVFPGHTIVVPRYQKRNRLV